jgi:hypothetical protein
VLRVLSSQIFHALSLCVPLKAFLVVYVDGHSSSCHGTYCLFIIMIVGIF